MNDDGWWETAVHVGITFLILGTVGSIWPERVTPSEMVSMGVKLLVVGALLAWWERR